MSTTSPCQIAWARRNRLQETGGDILAWTDASVTPEDGTTYTVEAFAVDALGGIGVQVVDDKRNRRNGQNYRGV